MYNSSQSSNLGAPPQTIRRASDSTSKDLSVPLTLLDLTDENITSNCITISTQNNPSPRLAYLTSRLITHLHDFVRETRLTTDEWLVVIDFLTRTGQACSDTRQEFILLSDVLGVSTLVQAINHPKPEGATEGTVLGPFHNNDAKEFDHGGSISSEKSIHDSGAERMVFQGEVFDVDTGEPIPGAKIDTWETDATGRYDTQYQERNHLDNRGIFHSDKHGKFWFKCIKPVSYGVPDDGPVGAFLRTTGRHYYRPAHLHFLIEKAGYDRLVTALYLKGDKYETTDAVFGVKSSLIVEAGREEVDGDIVWSLKYRFGMVGEQKAKELRVKAGLEALEKVGLPSKGVKVLDGLPVMD